MKLIAGYIGKVKDFKLIIIGDDIKKDKPVIKERRDDNELLTILQEVREEVDIRVK